MLHEHVHEVFRRLLGDLVSFSVCALASSVFLLTTPSECVQIGICMYLNLRGHDCNKLGCKSEVAAVDTESDTETRTSHSRPGLLLANPFSNHLTPTDTRVTRMCLLCFGLQT